MSTPLLNPRDCGHELFLYLASSESKIVMVIVQEDSAQKEHVIFDLSEGIVGPGLWYLHVEKLALEVVHDVQHLQHYILL